MDNKAGVSQRRLDRQFGASQSTISRNLKKRISVRIYKRKSAPKYINEDQQRRAKSNCLKLYKKLSPDCQLIWDDEKYFTLSDDVLENSRYYLSAPSSTPTNIRFKQKQKYEVHLLVCVIKPPVEEFPVPTFIVRRLLDAKKHI